MKKNLLRLLAVVLAAVMLLTLAACGGKDDSGSADSSSQSSSESSAVEDSSSEPSADENGLVDGKYPSIQAFLDDPQVSEQIDAMVDALAEGDLDIKVQAEGSKLVYVFTFAEFPDGTDLDAIAASLEENMAGQASVFENIATSIKEVVNEDDPKVVVTYNAADGTEIFSQEFSAT